MSKAVDIGLTIYPITDIQLQYLNDLKHRFFVVSAGRRSRKTLIGRKKILFNAILNQNHKYFMAAPTHDQAKSIFWEGLKKQTKLLDIQKKHGVNESDLTIFLKNGTKIKIVGIDRPERIEGETPSWNGGLITEAPNCKKEAWYEHIRPLFSDTHGFCILDGVPDSRHQWHKDLALYATGGFIPSTKPLEGAYAENPNDPEYCYYSWFSSDVLTPGEIESVKRQLDERTYKQEYEGSFENPGGLVYYAYQERNIMNLEYDSSRDTIITFDFNVSPGTAIILQMFEPDQWCAVTEFSRNDTNTSEMGTLAKDFIEQNGLNAKLWLTGDYTGTARKTSASSGSQSDWKILEQIFKAKPKIKQVSIKDSVNSLNGMFYNTFGEMKLYVNANNCPKLHRDLTRQNWKDNGDLNDENGTIGHKSDALRYFAENFYPITRINYMDQVG
jgi:hypothetical protein